MPITYKGRTTHIGLVLDAYTRSEDCGYDTSYHATVWNWDKMKSEIVNYGDTRGIVGQCQVDAIPIVKELFKYENDKRFYDNKVLSLLRETCELKIEGMLVLAARGRTAKGQILTITKIYMNDTYGRGLAKNNEGHSFEVYMKNLDVLAYPFDPNTYIPFLPPKPVVVSDLEKLLYSNR